MKTVRFVTSAITAPWHSDALDDVVKRNNALQTAVAAGVLAALYVRDTGLTNGGVGG